MFPLTVTQVLLTRRKFSLRQRIPSLISFPEIGSRAPRRLFNLRLRLTSACKAPLVPSIRRPTNRPPGGPVARILIRIPIGFREWTSRFLSFQIFQTEPKFRAVRGCQISAICSMFGQESSRTTSPALRPATRNPFPAPQLRSFAKSNELSGLGAARLTVYPVNTHSLRLALQSFHRHADAKQRRHKFGFLWNLWWGHRRTDQSQWSGHLHDECERSSTQRFANAST